MSSNVGHSDIQFDLPAMLDIGIKSIAAISGFELQSHEELGRLLSYIRRHVIQFMQIPNQHLCGMLLDLETCIEQCVTSYQADMDRRERIRSTLRSALQLIFNRVHGFVEFEIHRRRQSPSETPLPEFESVRSSVPFPSSRRLPALPVTDSDFGIQTEYHSFPRFLPFSAMRSNNDRSAEIQFLCHQIASRLEAIEHNAPAVLIIYGKPASSISEFASDVCDEWRKRLPKSEIVCRIDRFEHDLETPSNRFWHQNAMKSVLPPQMCAPDISNSESIQMIPISVNVRRAIRTTPSGRFQFSVTKSHSDSLECQPIKAVSSQPKATHFPYSDLRRQYLSQFYGKSGVICLDHAASVEDALVLAPPLPGYLSIICCSDEDVAHSIAQHVHKQEVSTELPQCLFARRCIQTPICWIHELRSTQLEPSPRSTSESAIEIAFSNAATDQRTFICCFQSVFRLSCCWDAVKLSISQCHSHDEFVFLESLLSTGLLQCTSRSDANVQFSISDSVRECARNCMSNFDATASSDLQTRINAFQHKLLDHVVANVWLPLTQTCYINALPRLALLQFDRHRFELEYSFQMSITMSRQFLSTMTVNSLDSVDPSYDRAVCSSELRAFEKQFSTTFTPSWLLMLRPHAIFRLRFSKQQCFVFYSTCLRVVSLPWTPSLLHSALKLSSKPAPNLDMVSDKIFSFAVLMLQYQAEIILALGDLVNAATSSELRSFEVDGAAVRSAPEYFSDAHSIAIKLRHICSDDADFSAILASVTSRLGLIANQASPVNLDTTVEHFQQALQLDQLSVSQYFASKKLEASAWSVDHLNEICTGMLNSSLLPHQVHDRLSVITASRTQLAASLKRAGAFQNALQHLEAAVCSTESEFELYLQLLPLVEHDMRFFSNDSSDSNFAPIPVDGFVAFSSLQSHLCKTFKSSEFVSAIHSTKVALLSCISQLATLHLQIAQIYELAGATSLAAVSASKSLDMIEMVDKHSADLRWSILSPSLAASASRALVSEAMQSNEQQQLWDALALMDASRLRLQISGACAAYADCCQVCALLLCRIGQFDRIRVLFSEACVVFEYLRDHRRLIASLIQLGNTHTACRNLDGALTSLYDAVALARAWEAHCADIKPRISMQRSRSLHNGSFWEPLPSDVAWEIVGDNLSSFSDSDSESEEWHARAAEIRAESLASALQAIGNTLLASGEHEAALDSLRESVGLWQRLANGRRDRTDRQRDKVSRRRRHSRLSDAASLDLSDLNESFGRAMVRSKSVDDSEVAAVNISMSSAPPAALLSPFEPDRSASHRSALTASLLSMAVCQTRLGQFTKAVVALSKCRRARIDCDDWLGVAEVSDHFGYLYHSIGDFSTAIEQLQESRRIYIRLNAFHASYFASGSLLHGTLFAMRDIDKTIDLLGVLLDRHDRAGNAFAIAVVNRALGRALLSGGDTTAALTHLQLAATQFDALRSLSEFVAPTELEHEIRAVRAAITEAEQHQK